MSASTVPSVATTDRLPAGWRNPFDGYVTNTGDPGLFLTQAEIGSSLMELCADGVYRMPAVTGTAQPIYVNFGSGTVFVDIAHYNPQSMALSLRKLADDSIRQKAYFSPNMSVKLLWVKVASMSPSYLAHLKVIARDDAVFRPLGVPVAGVTGSSVPVYIFGNMILCGCCGEQLVNISDAVVKHAAEKGKFFDMWLQNKYSACTLCSLTFDGQKSAIEHYYGHNHSTRMNMCITGDKEGSINDIRLFKGYPMPHISCAQSTMAFYLFRAPLAILMAIHKTTQVDIANTQELPMAMTVELQSTRPDTKWLPDCPVCDPRYFLFNTVHYSAISAMLPQRRFSPFMKRKCGHHIPEFTAEELELFRPITILGLIADKLKGVKKYYGCAAFKTAAKKDDYDDEDGYNDKYRHFFNLYADCSWNTLKDANLGHQEYYRYGSANTSLATYVRANQVLALKGYYSLADIPAQDFIPSSSSNTGASDVDEPLAFETPYVHREVARPSEPKKATVRSGPAKATKPKVKKQITHLFDARDQFRILHRAYPPNKQCVSYTDWYNYHGLEFGDKSNGRKIYNVRQNLIEVG